MSEENPTKIEIPKPIFEYVTNQDYFPILYTSFEDFVLDAVRARMLELKKTAKPLREIQIPTKLYNELSKLAKYVDLTVDDYVEQMLRN